MNPMGKGNKVPSPEKIGSVGWAEEREEGEGEGRIEGGGEH